VVFHNLDSLTITLDVALDEGFVENETFGFRDFILVID
jgi:hypothetical protein